MKHINVASFVADLNGTSSTRASRSTHHWRVSSTCAPKATTGATSPIGPLASMPAEIATAVYTSQGRVRRWSHSAPVQMAVITEAASIVSVRTSLVMSRNAAVDP